MSTTYEAIIKKKFVVDLVDADTDPIVLLK